MMWVEDQTEEEIRHCWDLMRPVVDKKPCCRWCCYCWWW